MSQDSDKSNRFEEFFNPDDLSNWSGTSQEAFFVIMARAISEEITYIKLIAELIRQHPNSDTISITFGTMSLRDMMADIISRTDKTQRVLKTGIAHMQLH
ncbi:MAG: hypothetical protein JNJ61_24085 [Anaerolineae bacterium]|nr:hypothetical protein [Anaerolineae bacterium]